MGTSNYSDEFKRDAVQQIRVRGYPVQETVDLALLMPLDDGGEGFGQPRIRVNAVHLAGLDQRGDDGPVPGSGIMPCKEGVLAVQGDGAFDGIAVDLDATVGKEATKAFAVFCDVGQGLAEG